VIAQPLQMGSRGELDLTALNLLPSRKKVKVSKDPYHYRPPLKLIQASGQFPTHFPLRGRISPCRIVG